MSRAARLSPTPIHITAALLTAALLVGVSVDACGQHSRPEGPPMTSAPSPPPGFKQQPVIPTSQQQAQDTVLGYWKKTLQELPAGTTLDATRYGGADSTAPCNDDIQGTPSKDLSTIGELKLPPGTDPVAVVAKTGDIWKGWGWYVIERDGFRKPNRFGYAPDGYSLQIKAKDPTEYPPTLIAVSPCFPGDLPDDRDPFPMILTAD
jgi:hypothetical protein